MSFYFNRTADGSAPVTRYMDVDQVTIVAGDLLMIDTSGYVSNTLTSAYTSNLAGVAEAGVTGSSVTAGTTKIPVQINRSAIYLADTVAAATQTEVGTNVTCSGSPMRNITESTAKDAGLGIVRIIKLMDAVNTAKAVEVMLNFDSAVEL